MKRQNENQATHRQLVKLAHDVLRHATHQQRADLGDLTELVKQACSRHHFVFRNSGEIARALDSAQWQRRFGGPRT